MSDAESSGSRPRGLGRMARLFGGATAPFKRDEPGEAPLPFDPEDHITEKREWAKRQAAASAAALGAPPPAPRLYEHFCIVGLPPDINVKAVSADIQTYTAARRAGVAAPALDVVPGAAGAAPKQYGQVGPALPAQVLVSYPPEEPLPDDLAASLAAFCFPHGVFPELLERTPSMSNLNEVVFGQPHATQADHSFVFRMDAAGPGDPAPRPLYGVCCLAPELVHRPPALARGAFPGADGVPLARYMVTAPRCYVILSRFPFFDAHFSVLATVLGLERLERTEAFAGEVALGLMHGGAASSGGEAPPPGADEGDAGGRRRTHPDPSSFAGDLTTTTSATASSSYTTDAEETSHQGSLCGGAAFATPPAAAAGAPAPPPLDPRTVEGPRRGAVSSRGLSEGSGRLSPAVSVASLEAESSLGSELATPSEPLLPATPFYTPATAANPAALLLGERGAARRRTRVHGAASPAPLEPGGLDALDDPLNERVARVKELLDDSLVELDNRLGPSPAGAGAPAPDAASAAKPPLPRPALLDADATPPPAAPGGDLLPPLDSGPLPAGEPSEEDSYGGYATAPQSSGPSMDLGPWVGAPSASVTATGPAADAAGTPGGDEASSAPAPRAQGSGADLAGLNDSLAALLALEAPQPAAAAEEEGAGAAAEAGAGEGRLDAAEVLAQYRALPVPAVGEETAFQPDPALQPLRFRRPAAASPASLGLRPDAPILPDLEAAGALLPWTVAALCRCLSLDSILAFLTAALLERQTVLFCPNGGLLCGTALSLVPLLLPFSWQSLLLPVLPATPERLDLLEAPVPFVVGCLFKTPDIRARCGGLVRVNVYKDRVRNAGQLPALPGAAALAAALAGPHAALRRAGAGAGARPVHAVSPEAAEAAGRFAAAVGRHLRGLVADLKGYALTDVSATGGGPRVSVLLKESFLESFPPRDRPFMRAFAETQMFAVYCDAVL